MKIEQTLLARPVRRVVVATDFSPGAEAAVTRALQIAAVHHAHVDLLHSYDVGALRALRRVFDAERLLGRVGADRAIEGRLRDDAARLASASGLEVEPCFSAGDPAVAIAARVQSMHAALAVLARRGEPGAYGIGSTLLNVLRQVPSAVLVVRPGAEPADDARPYATVLAAVDQREVSQRTAAAAAALFPTAQHLWLGVVDATWEREVWRAGGITPELAAELPSLAGALGLELERLAAAMAEGRPVRPRIEIADGIASRVIVDRARALGACCVAVGRHGQGGLGERLLGSTALDVIHHSGRDVLVVP